MVKKICCVLSFCLLVSVVGRAQDENMSRSLSFLEVNTDARSAGMGNAQMGNAGNSFLYNNPSAFFISEKNIYASYGIAIYPKTDAGTNIFHSASGGYKLADKHAFMVGGRCLGGLKISSVDKNGNVGRSIKPMDWSVDLGYALRTSDNFAFSVGLGFFQSDNYTVARGVSFGVGLSYNNFIKGIYRYTISADIKDVGPKFKYGKSEQKYHMPTSVGLGGSVELPLHKDHAVNAALFSRYYIYPNDASALIGGVGVEYGFRRMLYARCGYQVGDDNNYATVGAGFRYSFLQLNLAYNFADNKDFNLVKAGLCVTF